jgi:hypothetical protein
MLGSAFYCGKLAYCTVNVYFVTFEFVLLVLLKLIALMLAQRMVGAVLVVSSGAGVKFAQSSSQREVRAKTCIYVPNLADQ